MISTVLVAVASISSFISTNNLIDPAALTLSKTFKYAVDRIYNRPKIDIIRKMSVGFRNTIYAFEFRHISK